MSKKSKKPDSVTDPDFDKASFPFSRVDIYPSENLLTTHAKAKKGATKKFEEYFCVLYLDYILFYKVQKGKEPKRKDEPEAHVYLSGEFSYRQVAPVEQRVIITGLIPKTKKFENTIGIGPEKEEWLIKLDTEEEMVDWYSKTRSTCKHTRKSLQQLEQIPGGAHELIQDLKTTVPQNFYALTDGPVRKWREEDWINEIIVLWQKREEHFEDVKKLMLFAEYYNLDNAQYLDWFVAPGGATISLEKDLHTAEDSFVLGWKNKFLDYTTVENQLDDEDISQKANLVEYCKHMMHLIDMYNLYGLEVHCNDYEFEADKAKWRLYIQRIEGLISNDEMRKEQEEARKLAVEEEIEKQKEDEEAKLVAESDARAADPFSSQNLLKKEEDPFSDVMLLNVVDIYGSIEGEIWTPPPVSETEVQTDDDFLESLFMELEQGLSDVSNKISTPAARPLGLGMGNIGLTPKPSPGLRSNNFGGLNQPNLGNIGITPKPGSGVGTIGVTQRPVPIQNRGGNIGITQRPTPIQNRGGNIGITQRPTPIQNRGGNIGITQRPTPMGIGITPKPGAGVGNNIGVTQKPAPLGQPMVPGRLTPVPKPSPVNNQPPSIRREAPPSVPTRKYTTICAN
eukprot:TRINITY_DN375_c0_g1_i5.p1 TRINITY_DN375_c0_g1~~TRINITY_DN375_c0_g1_i5.p1  ORF type:complete len:622 (+),score=177.41 TRINITY_DN375_c0_g1_i5:40-1905(+)